MKQPKIKIFGKVHNVKHIEFNDNGTIESIVYKTEKNINRTVFRSDVVINETLTSERKIQKPTEHPFHDYVYAPNLEDLLC